MLHGDFRAENPYLTFLNRARESNLDINICPKDFLKELQYQILAFVTLESGLKIHIHADKDFYYNPSLYQRPKEDFEYTVKVLEIISEQSYFEAICEDTGKEIPYEPEKFMAMMLDENGNIKPAGLGGPEKGQWGDTVWNAFSSIEDSME